MDRDSGQLFSQSLGHERSDYCVGLTAVKILALARASSLHEALDYYMLV